MVEENKTLLTLANQILDEVRRFFVGKPQQVKDPENFEHHFRLAVFQAVVDHFDGVLGWRIGHWLAHLLAEPLGKGATDLKHNLIAELDHAGWSRQDEPSNLLSRPAAGPLQFPTDDLGLAREKNSQQV